MLQIQTSFTPFRLRLNDKKPISLKVTVRNVGEKEEIVSFDVVVSRALSLDKGGYKNRVQERLGGLKTGEKVDKYYEVYPKQMARKGSYPALVKATEHYQNYELVKKEYKKNIEVIVEE